MAEELASAFASSDSEVGCEGAAVQICPSRPSSPTMTYLRRYQAQLRSAFRFLSDVRLESWPNCVPPAFENTGHVTVWYPQVPSWYHQVPRPWDSLSRRAAIVFESWRADNFMRFIRDIGKLTRHFVPTSQELIRGSTYEIDGSSD
jgi:hypothetical protein